MKVIRIHQILCQSTRTATRKRRQSHAVMRILLMMPAVLVLVQGFLQPRQIQEFPRASFRTRIRYNLDSRQTFFHSSLRIREHKRHDFSPQSTCLFGARLRQPTSAIPSESKEIQSTSRRRKRRTWRQYFPKLQKFYQQHGHSHVNFNEDEDLHIWTENIRKTYRGKRRQELGPEKLKALKALGFSWSRSQPQRKAPIQQKTTHRNQRATSRQRKWQEYYPMLEEFHSIHGHCNVTAADNKNLHKWVASLRKNYQCQAIVRDLAPAVSRALNDDAQSASPLLSDEQFEALQALNFTWSTKKQKIRKGMKKWKTWDEYFPRLVGFYKTHGHCNITLSEHDDEDHKDLYEFRQSLPYRRYTEEKAQLLQQLGVSLKVQTRATWKPLHRKEMIDRLHVFYNEHGHVVVTSDDNDPELHEWTQRYIRSHTYKNLCRLVIPNYGKTRKDEKWQTEFDRLKDYHMKHGHFNIRGDSKLYNFVQHQRKQYRKLVKGEKSQLTQKRIEALEQIGFHWGKSHDIRWKERIEELDTFTSIYGHPAVPQEFEQNPQLGKWVMNQRSLKRSNNNEDPITLRKDRVEDLDRREFIWNVRNKQWWDKLQMAKEFQAAHGHLNVTTSDPTYASLRQWLSDQRHFYRSTKLRHRLTEDRIEALESLPGFEWRIRFSESPSKTDWSNLLNAMREKGISSKAKVKAHWFDGLNPFEQEVKTVWTDEDIMALWNEEGEDTDADEYYYEDEDSKNFLRA
ncbi:MAG: hypothetical protein SGILL_009410 [Bacillariaceae sp.]